MNKNLKKIKMNPIRYYSQGIASFKDGIDLSVGEGHFECSFYAKLASLEALLNNETKYGKVDGDINLRKLLIEHYYKQYKYEDEIIITNGSTQGLFSVLQSIINKNDEVIIFSPHYPAYENIVKLLGGKVVLIDTKDTNFKIDENSLSSYLTNKTKAIIINEPCNPTGVTYSLDEKMTLLNFFKKGKYYIIVDELYRLYTKSDFYSFSELFNENSKLKSRFIFINGLSKSHLLTGFRIGFVVSCKEVVDELKKLNYLNISCVSTITQKGAIGAVNDHDYYKFVHTYYLNNLEIMKKNLDYLNVPFVMVNSGYYLFIDVSKFNLTGIDFCKLFLERYHTALVPGIIFGVNYDNYIRISCCKDVKDIIKFCDNLINFTEIS